MITRHDVPSTPPAVGATRPASGARARILAAATEEFAERGYEATTIRQIAQRGGNSTAALYVHFGSKEELLWELAEQGHRDLVDEVTACTRGLTGVADQLAAWVRTYVAFHASNPQRARVVTLQLESLSDEHLAAVRDLRRELDFQLRFLIEYGVRSGEFSTPHPHLTTAAILSLGIDLGRWFRAGRGWSADAVVEHYTELALRMVGSRDG